MRALNPKKEKEKGKMEMKFIISSMLAYAALLSTLSTSEPVEDKHALLDFIGNISHSRSLNWDQNTPACNNWTGITCNVDESRITAVRLPAVGLKGSVPSNTLGRLSDLQILSLRSNALTGPFPYDLLLIRSLTGIYLQDNHFRGPLPPNLSVWTNLTVLILSNNRFNGSIPPSMSSLSRLQSLNLSNNSFTGEIPDLDVPGLSSLDLSNNDLTGPVPRSLLRFPRSAFSGNNVSFAPAQSPSSHETKKRISESAVLGIVIGSCALSFIAIAILLIIMNRFEKHDHDSSTTAHAHEKKGSNKNPRGKKPAHDQHHDPNSTLAFFEGCSVAFDLEDLLRASAEVLGKGTFGTTYRAALEDANASFAVKRLTKAVTVGRAEFVNHMEAVGNIRHANVAPLRAYYYSKDEKLLIYDYYGRGSLSSLLHDEMRRKALNWETRISIAVESAKGIACIHSESSGNKKKLVHGNIKASNVLFDSEMRVRVSDSGLQAVMTTRPQHGGYCAPELLSNARKGATRASDVYSFGVLILELLTGKSPNTTTATRNRGAGDGFNLVRWVQSVVREEWTGEVFDADLLKGRHVEEDMVEMLQLGMSCVAKVAEQRPEIGDVVKVLEGIRGRDVRSDDDDKSDGVMSLGSTPSVLL